MSRKKKNVYGTGKPNADEICELSSELEESMGEMAAFSVACEQLGISEEEAYEIIASEQANEDKAE